MDRRCEQCGGAVFFIERSPLQDLTAMTCQTCGHLHLIMPIVVVNGNGGRPSA